MSATVLVDVSNRVIEDDAEQIVALAFSEDGEVLVGGDADGTIHVWEGAALTTRHRLEDSALDTLYDVALFEHRAVAVGDGDLELWDVDAGTLERSWPMPAGREVQAVCFVGPDRVAAVGDAERLWLFDLEGQLLAELPFGGERNESLTYRDGLFVCAAARQRGGRLRFARLEGNRLLAVEGPAITEPTDSMSGAAVSPDGSLYAFTGRDLHVFSSDGTLALSFSADGEPVTRSESPAVLTERWSRPLFLDQHRVVCGTPKGGALVVFDVAKKRIANRYEGHGERHVSALAYDRGRLVSAGRDFSVRVTEL